MTWKPEGTTSVRESEESRLEWIQRNFRKLSQWSGRWVQQGHGGMYVAEQKVISPPVVMTTTYQKMVAFDTALDETNVGIETDLANSQIRLTQGGVWVYLFSACGKLTPFQANVGQAIEFASYNATTGIYSTFGYSPVSRDQEWFDVSVSQLRNVRRASGDWISLWARLVNATPSLSFTEVASLEISAFRVGQGVGGIDSTLVTAGILS